MATSWLQLSLTALKGAISRLYQTWRPRGFSGLIVHLPSNDMAAAGGFLGGERERRGDQGGDFLPSRKMDRLAASSAAFALAAQWRVIRSERGERLRREAGNWQAVGKRAQDLKSLPLALEAIEDLVICGTYDFVPDGLPSWPPDSGIRNPVPAPAGRRTCSG